MKNRWTNIDWETGELITDADQLNTLNAGKTMWAPFIGSAVFSDWAVEDASFLRLQSLTVGYTLPSNITEKVHLRRARIYATGTNLFCLTKYSGYDPDVNAFGSDSSRRGVDVYSYPAARSFTLGVSCIF